MAYKKEDLQKIDDLAIEYYNEEDTARKKVINEKIAILFMNNLEYIIHTGRLKKLSADAKRAEIVKDVSINKLEIKIKLLTTLIKEKMALFRFWLIFTILYFGSPVRNARNIIKVLKVVKIQILVKCMMLVVMKLKPIQNI